MTIKVEEIRELENKLTELKAESVIEKNMFGQGIADKQIKAINQTLNLFGAGFRYSWDESQDKWVAHIYF